MGRLLRVRWLAMAGVCLLGARVDAVGEDVVSPNIPLHHWCYDVLEKFAAEGLVDRGAVHARPLDRYAVGRLVAGLMDGLDDVSEGNRALIRRLRRAFRREVDVALGGGKGQGLIRRPSGWVGATRIRASRAMQKNVDPYERIEFGRGNTWGFDGGIGANVTDRAAVFGSGYVFRTSEEDRAELRSAYVRFSLYGTAVQVGRDALRWGPGYHGDFLLTDNAPSFPMVRADRDAGPVMVSVLLARIRNGSEGDGKNVLGGWRIVWPYRDRLVLEAGLTSVFEEERQTLSNLVPGRSNRHANQVGELGITLYLARGVKMYAVSAGDDIQGKRIMTGGLPWGGRTGHLVGLYLSDPVGDGKTDFRFELCRFRQDARWYLHELGFRQYSRDSEWYVHRFGYFHRGYVIGHHVGRRTLREGQRRSERDIFVRVSHRPWAGTSVTLEYHRDSADATFPMSYVIIKPPDPTPVQPTREIKQYRSYLHVGILHDIARGWHVRLAGKFLPALWTVPHPTIPGAVMEWYERKEWMYTVCVKRYVS